jgi:anti-sigma factor RsiW
MTCTRYETDLALYVERDLSDADAASVEAHLRECPTCPAFLAELRASQALVKDVAAEEVPEEALAAVHMRTLVAAERARRAHRAFPAWAAAAPAPRVIPSPATASTPRSTLPAPPPVSPRMEQARRGPAKRPSVVPALSPDDADQLARAVVAIARIGRVDEAPIETEPSPAAAALMRLATADPDVVIYWQLEPSGGE